ncbi:VirB4 family type IV secretion system protein [[Clostridium] symbiosum]|uniref:VirB4 family type IV secretion system protein n=1 Tax=Clostridium symbiosum TaxID=1512 RepID=UPI0025A40270|nr:ATP-binding protein [[Clostridium] symbiosum]MDM8134378.1 ATP-binding protein [[Clostridium] symbiosum]MDM8138422.1 ATP-binding protein [[Clostridium] symbiosum]MDM8317991.1 ATP-binding protein [[Clostridium] symbiosum]
MAEKSMAERKRSPASQLRTIKKAYSRERRTKKLGRIEVRPEEKKERKEMRSCKPFRPEGPVDVGPVPRSLAAGCIPITGITDGIIHTSDGRHVKIVEVMPVNFLLRSPVEQRNIIYSFIGYLKIAPVKLQIKVLSKKADISGFLENIRRDKEKETDERCRLLQEDYASLIRSVGSREAISRRFFLIFEYETYRSSRNQNDIVAVLNTAVQTAKKYLSQCGNEVIIPEHDTQACVEVLYHILNRRTSTMKTLNQRMNEVVAWYIRENGEESVENIPITEFFAPESIDFKHGNYIVMDGVYHTYLFIPSAGYRSRVPAGWLSLLVNAGEGIDIDVFLYKQDKAKSVERIGRRIRLNSSKIKEVSDTNSDYDDLAESIQAGYYLKNGLGSSEDLYYMSILITVTGYSADEVEWRAKEMKKLLNSQDIDTMSCLFKEENAFQSALPLLNLDKNLYQRSKRNLLTSGVASCYPFTSYEMSDRDGILMGVNKANSSLVIVDIFNSEIYKNANMAIMGTTGAGKTFTLQLMALRMRRKGIQVFIIAPDKGHEFARACENIGGAFIQISPASLNCINVMEIRKTDKAASDILDGPLVQHSELASKIQDLHIFFSLLIPDMSHEEKQLLDEALIITYNREGITHENQSLIDPENPGRYRAMPILGDVYEVLMEKTETKRLANILNRMVHGSASSFNQQTNVDLSNKYVVLDISELSGDLLTVGMFVALDFVWSKAKEDRTVEKAIFIDEVWKLIGAASNEMAAEYVLEIFKIIRGYGGSGVCATQDLTDFFALKDGKYGRGIINNAKTKIILNMENNEAEQIKEVLHLSEAEMMSIVRFERGNGMISTNNNNLTVEFRASQLEKDLITTDRKDLKELRERLERYGKGAMGKRFDDA